MVCCGVHAGFYRRVCGVFVYLVSLTLFADVTPSYYSIYEVSPPNQPNQIVYNVVVIVPAPLRDCTTHLLAGAQPDQMEFSQKKRLAARTMLRQEYAQEGFEVGPGNVEREFDSVLEDTILVLVTTPIEPNRDATLLGQVSVSYDLGSGTAGERRLKQRLQHFSGFPRSENPTDRFLDFSFRASAGGLWVSTPESLILSARKFRVGGPHAVAEIKNLKFARQAIQDYAQMLNFQPLDLQMHTLAILQHFLATHATLFSAEMIAPENQIIVPSESELSERLAELTPKIQALYPNEPQNAARLIEQMRSNALEPPPQPFSLIDGLYAYAGEMDPTTGADRPKTAAKRMKLWAFDDLIAQGMDPDLPPMTVLVGRTPVFAFQTGTFLERPGRLTQNLIGNAGPEEPIPLLFNPFSCQMQFNHLAGVQLSYLRWINPYHHERLSPLDELP